MPTPTPLSVLAVESSFYTASTRVNVSIVFGSTVSTSQPPRPASPPRPWHSLLGPGPAGVQDGLALWLDATTLPPGAPVAKWADHSGLGHDATQPSAAAQPMHVPACLHGLPCVRFDGNTSFLQGPLPMPSDKTIVAAFRDTGSSTACCSGLLWLDSCDGLSTKNVGGGVYLSIDWSGSGNTGTTNILNTSVVATVTYNSTGSAALLWSCVDSLDGTIMHLLPE